jgi:hypothetical protein
MTVFFSKEGDNLPVIPWCSALPSMATNQPPSDHCVLMTLLLGDQNLKPTAFRETLPLQVQ